jgi:hypothetical protein
LDGLEGTSVRRTRNFQHDADNPLQCPSPLGRRCGSPSKQRLGRMPSVDPGVGSVCYFQGFASSRLFSKRPRVRRQTATHSHGRARNTRATRPSKDERRCGSLCGRSRGRFLLRVSAPKRPKENLQTSFPLLSRTPPLFLLDNKVLVDRARSSRPRRWRVETFTPQARRANGNGPSSLNAPAPCMKNPHRTHL